MDKIYYMSGYDYQLHDTYFHQLPERLYPSEKIEGRFLSVTDSGWMAIKSGYAWDGPSGPTIATKTFMRGSLVHDALAQLAREGKLDSKLKKYMDRELVKICKEDGMSGIRRWYVYRGLSLVDNYVKASSLKKVHVAP